MDEQYNYSLISKYRTHLMGLAILWIAFFHSTISLSNPIINLVKTIGYGGVDIFLMLSGVGLYFAYQKNSNALIFYKRRFLRIIPTYVPIVFGFGMALIIFRKMSLVSLIMNVTTLSFWLNSADRFDWYIPSLILLYLIAPIILYLFKTRNKYIMTTLFSFIGILLSILIQSSKVNYLIIFTARIPIFFIGMLVGYWVDINKKCSKKHIVFHSIILIVGLIWLYVSIRYFPNKLWRFGLWWYPFILITLPLCMFISIILDFITGLGLKKFTLLTFCGNHSLEIYLFHERAIIILSSVFKNINVNSDRILFNSICFILSLVIAFLWKKIITYHISKTMCIKKRMVANSKSQI